MVYKIVCDVIVDVIIGDDDNDSTSIVHSLMWVYIYVIYYNTK